MHRRVALAVVAAAVGSWSSQALAIPHCGYGPASWSAPNGALVLYQGPGSITTVLNAVGEHLYSHSMLSHGPANGYVSHATMDVPGPNSYPNICYYPVDPNVLNTGAPGAEQVTQAAIYTFLQAPAPIAPYSDAQGYLHTNLDYQLGNPTTAANIGNGLWGTQYDTSQSDSNSSEYYYHVYRNGARQPYTFFQFRSIEGTNVPGGTSLRNGVVCSTFLAWAHASFGGWVVSPYTYNHSQLTNAAYGLWNNINSDCQNGAGSWATAAIWLTGACSWVNPLDPFPNLCGRAANQVTNCMGTGNCADTSTTWVNITNDPASTATSISPERLGGWEAHPWTLTSWSPDIAHPVTWNSPGSVYDCWE